MTLEDDSSVTVNSRTGSYSAVWKGVEITRNNSVFCPIDTMRIAFYSLEEKTLEYPIPQSWTGKQINARALYKDHAEEYKFTLNGSTLSVKVMPRRPVIVYIEL